MSGRFSAQRAAAPGSTADSPTPVVAAPELSTLPFKPDTIEADADATERMIDVKVRLHRRLLDDINLAAIEKMSSDEIRPHVHSLVGEYVAKERLALTSTELDTLVSEIMDEMLGLGPIEPLLKDPTINDILINGPSNIFVERKGQLEPVAIRFQNEAHLMRIIQRIVSTVGRRVDEFSRCAMRAFPTGHASMSRCGP